jgi:hypothetical protein
MAERVVDKATFERLFTSRWTRLRAFGFREIVGGWWECSKLAWWLSVPWQCKLGRCVIVTHEDWNEDAHAVESRWRECSRCGGFKGYPDD